MSLPCALGGTSCSEKASPQSMSLVMCTVNLLYTKHYTVVLELNRALGFYLIFTLLQNIIEADLNLVM